MAITSIGYDGTVDEVAWAKLHPAASTRPQVISGGPPSIVSGVDRTVRVPALEAYGFGVYVTNDANVDLQAASVASGSRWDTVVLRRDWGTNASSFVIVQGTATQAVSASVQSNPGVTADQVLALIRIDAGVTAIAALVDMREWHASPFVSASGITWPDANTYPYGQVTVQSDGKAPDVGVRRGTAPSAYWDQVLARPWSNLTLNIAVVAQSGPVPQWRVVGDVFELRGTFNPSGGGKFTAGNWYTVTNLSASVRPLRSHAFVVAAYGLTAATYNARCEVLTDGTVRVKVASDANLTEMTLDGLRFSLT